MRLYCEIVGTAIIAIMSHLGAGAEVQGRAAPKGRVLLDIGDC